MYRKDYYPKYNNLLCRTTDCVPTEKCCNIPTGRSPFPHGIALSRCVTELPILRLPFSGIAVLRISWSFYTTRNQE
ncbi:hypothetical protein AYI68_g8226 [Smittium mucronatum]|uniref:Uncharacterized protein n=1 Tax=Smittium mucronatum TaxID=133383 RepID=A0A1R0GLJ0_9FUNG|nr:hypothetical protein AYI68_g8226 [Smittium mucronatum]